MSGVSQKRPTITKLSALTPNSEFVLFVPFGETPIFFLTEHLHFWQKALRQK
jgi:hypothetical protein